MSTELVSGLPRHKVAPQAVEHRVLAFVRQNPNSSRHAITFALCMSPSQVERAIRDLERGGEIERFEDWSQSRIDQERNTEPDDGTTKDA